VQYWNKKYSKVRAASLSLVAVLVLVVYFAVTSEVILGEDAIAPGAAQFLSFPLVVLISLAAFGWFKFIPVWIAVLTFLAGGAASITAFSVFLPSKSTVLVSRFEGDLHETGTTLFRTKLNRYFSDSPAGEVGRYFRTIDSHREAEAVLADLPEIEAIIWGTQRWINISFAVPEELARRVRVEVPWSGEVVSPRLANYIPVIGLSTDPQDATSHFLVDLFTGLSLDRKEFLSNELEAKRIESILYSSSQMFSPWMSFAHLAYPLLIISDAHLYRAIAPSLRGSDSLEIGELKCALDSYTEAASRLQPHDNPILRAAIFNNKGVALLIKGIDTGSLDLLRSARQHFQHVGLILTHPNTFGAEDRYLAEVARRNLRITRGVLRSFRGAEKGPSRGRRKASS